MKKDHWLLTVFILTFILSVTFSTISNILTIKVNEIVLSIVLVLVIIGGIIFDIIGTSTISAHESTFHALNAKKQKGARKALIMIKNSNKISSICNDIVGDVSGIISGAIGAVLSISLSTKFGLNNTITSIVIASLISSFTVGGKAIFKKYAMESADDILLFIAKRISIKN